MSSRRLFLDTPWWGLVLLPLLLVPVLVPLAFVFGQDVLDDASTVDGFVFAVASTLVLVLVVWISRCASAVLALAVFVVATTVTVAWGFVIFHDSAVDAFWRHVQEAEAGAYPEAWKDLDRDALYRAHMSRVLEEEDAAGLWDHLRVVVREGTWSWERIGPRRLGGKPDWVHRQGFWVVAGWTLQVLLLMVGNFIGAMGGAALVSGRREQAERADRDAGGDHTRRRLARALEAPDGPGIERIQRVMEVVARRQYGPPLAPERESEAAAHLLALSTRYYAGGPVTGTVLLLDALDPLRDALPEADFYDGARRLMNAFNRIYGKSPPMALPPLPGLDCRDLDTPKPPPPEERYARLTTPDAAFWDYDAYHELMRLPPERIPEDALAPLLQLTLRNTNRKLYDHLPIVWPLELVGPIGPRLHPALVHTLCDPEAEPSSRASRARLLSLAADWPEHLAEPLFRAALRSGWNDGAAHLPRTAWARRLVEEFADSPFGKPPVPR